MLAKFVNIILAVLFAVAAVLQYNDPDPWVWIPIYLFAAIMCAQAARLHFYPRLYVAGIIILSLYAAYLFFADEGVLDWIGKHNSDNIAETMKATKPWIEQTREFFGVLIIIVALLLNYYFSHRNKEVISI
jgi:hypothetical protein